jgi:heparan-sulfate lyase
VDRRFFVILDEAIGDAAGTLDLHFQFAPGPVVLDVVHNRAYTMFDDANVLVWLAEPAQAVLQGEEGWFAWTYNKRVPRIASRFRLPSTGAPAHALTLVVPFRGGRLPAAEASVDEASMDEGFAAGGRCPKVVVQLGSDRWQLGRDLGAGRAWCSPL